MIGKFIDTIIPEEELPEGEGVVMPGGGLSQLLHRGHLVVLQQLEDLCDGIALWDGDGDLRLGGGVHAHAGEQGAIVHVGVQGIGPRGDLGLASGDRGEQLEQALILDEPLFFQPVRHLVKAVLFVHGDGDLFFRLVQGQHVVGGDPAHAGQQNGHADDGHRIQHAGAGGKAAGVSSSAGTAGALTVFRMV